MHGPRNPRILAGQQPCVVQGAPTHHPRDRLFRCLNPTPSAAGSRDASLNPGRRLMAARQKFQSDTLTHGQHFPVLWPGNRPLPGGDPRGVPVLSMTDEIHGPRHPGDGKDDRWGWGTHESAGSKNHRRKGSLGSHRPGNRNRPHTCCSIRWNLPRPHEDERTADQRNPTKNEEKARGQPHRSSRSSFRRITSAVLRLVARRTSCTLQTRSNPRISGSWGCAFRGSTRKMTPSIFPVATWAAI